MTHGQRMRTEAANKIVEQAHVVAQRAVAHPVDRERRLAILAEEFAEVVHAGLQIRRGGGNNLESALNRFRAELIDLITYSSQMLEEEFQLYDEGAPLDPGEYPEGEENYGQ